MNDEFKNKIKELVIKEGLYLEQVVYSIDETNFNICAEECLLLVMKFQFNDLKTVMRESLLHMPLELTNFPSSFYR